jgi:tetratricopeptide (TPR) repeat protein
MSQEGMIIIDLGALVAEADSAVVQGNWAAAVSAYEVLVQNRPDEPVLKYELAGAYLKLGRLQDAARLLSQPGVIGQKKAKQRLASILIGLRKFKEAQPLVDELIATSPSNSKFLAWKALCDLGPLEEKLHEGQELVSSGRLSEAEQLYLKLLDEHPDTSRAFQNLGNIYAVQKRWPEAVDALRAAFEIDSNNEKLRRSLARARLKNGEVVEALELLQQGDGHVIDPKSLILLQQCHFKLCDWPAVEEVSARLLDVLPIGDSARDAVSATRVDALVEIEAAGLEQAALSGDLNAQILGLKGIAGRHPTSASAWLKLATALADAQHIEEAANAARTAVGLRPSSSKARAKLIEVIIMTWDDDEVLRFVQESIAGGTADIKCYIWLGRYHYKNHNWEAALHSAQTALGMDPQNRSALFIKARALMRLNHLSEALDDLNLLLSIDPNRIGALQLKADIFVRLANVDAAIDLYQEALRKDPKLPLVKHRLSSAFLLKGNVAAYHPLHESRRALRTFLENNNSYPFVDWEGQLDLEGKLLVWSEFGLGVGQNILHMTFLKPLVRLGLKVVLQVEPRLVEICCRSFPDITVISNDAPLPSDVSHHTPIASLGRWFKPDLASFATMQPYLLPDVQTVKLHRRRLQEAAGEGQILVGISWTSDNPYVGDVKSVHLDKLLVALASPAVTLVNLQYGNHGNSINAALDETGARLIDSGLDNTNDLDGLAGVIAALDLVVCIGHTTAHIAGAVGTPNFVLLPSAPFAHWLERGKICIWYPSTTLFRQAAIDEDWGSVLAEVGGAVGDFVSDYKHEHWLSGTLLPALVASVPYAGTMATREVLDAVQCFEAQGAYRSALDLLGRLPPNYLTRDLLIRRGDMLTQIGFWQEALEIYVAQRPEEGLDVELERRILSVSLDMYDLETALSVAVCLADKEPIFMLTVANILYQQRRLDEALSTLRAASMSYPEADGLSTLTGTLLLEIGDFERAQKYLANQASMKRLAQDYSLLGQAMSLQGQHEGALVAYERALDCSKDHPSASFGRSQERLKTGTATPVALSPLLGDFPSVSKDDVVAFFAADSTYFWRHGLVLLESIGRNSPGVKCHVHLVNPDTSIPDGLQLIQALLPDLELSYSYEHVNFVGCSANHIRAYYASIRFVRLDQVFSRSPATYLCVDADCIVRGDVVADGSISQVRDVAIRLRYDERPNLSVAAGALVLRPTIAACKFIADVSSLIRSTLESRDAVWFLDQIVLSQVVRKLGGEQVEVTQLDMAYVDWFFRDDSIVWTGKGKRKSEDFRYMGEVSRYDSLRHNAELALLIQQASETPEL